LWVPPILRTIATDGTGVGELMAAIEQHAQHLHQSGDWGRRERARLEAELETMLTETLVAQFHQSVPDARYDELVDRLVERTLSPWEAVKILLE
jgi:LAO/AO transport system kinase